MNQYVAIHRTVQLTKYAGMFAVSLILFASSCAESKVDRGDAIEKVAHVLGTNKLQIEADDLLSMVNPNGDGEFVYVDQTRFSGVERFIIWLVIDETAYPLNGATKDVTPALSWPREAPKQVWEKTGLSQYSAKEAIDIVYRGAY